MFTDGGQKIYFISYFVNFLVVFVVIMFVEIYWLELLFRIDGSKILSKLENATVIGSNAFSFIFVITRPFIIIKGVLEYI